MMWGVTRCGDAACFIQTGVSLQLLVGSEPHQLTGDIPQSWSETNMDTGLFWPRQGQRTPESCLQRLHEAQPDLPGLMKFLSEGGAPMETSDTHPVQEVWAGEGAQGQGGRRAGVQNRRRGRRAAVLCLRGWSPDVPFRMSPPGPWIPFMLEDWGQGVLREEKLTTVRTKTWTGP